MPTSSVGKTSSRGVTLLELLIVTAIISLIAGLSYPALTSGIDSLRLNAASRSVVSFLNSGLNRADRRQQPVEITVTKADNSLVMRSTDPSFIRKLDLPKGITIVKIMPELPVEDTLPRSFMLYPGGSVPAVGVLLQNRRHVTRLVEVDPMTGVPAVTQPTS